MPIISVRIPQLGEGLQEALLVDFLKQPGDSVKRDEPIYVMETDKATTDVESPYAGTLVEWTVEPGSVLEIGTELAKNGGRRGCQGNAGRAWSRRHDSRRCQLRGHRLRQLVAQERNPKSRSHPRPASCSRSMACWSWLTRFRVLDPN